MSSFRQIFYHIVFSTKFRQPTILEKHEKELYKYIHGIIQVKKCKLYRINGTPDHLHILSDLHPTVSLSNFIKDIKLASGKWIKESKYFPTFNGWQTGYGAFTCSVRGRDPIIEYIKNQKTHHKIESFTDELKRLLEENEIPYDEKYLL